MRIPTNWQRKALPQEWREMIEKRSHGNISTIVGLSINSEAEICSMISEIALNIMQIELKQTSTKCAILHIAKESHCLKSEEKW